MEVFLNRCSVFSFSLDPSDCRISKYQGLGEGFPNRPACNLHPPVSVAPHFSMERNQWYRSGQPHSQKFAGGGAWTGHGVSDVTTDHSPHALSMPPPANFWIQGTNDIKESCLYPPWPLPALNLGLCKKPFAKSQDSDWALPLSFPSSSPEMSSTHLPQALNQLGTATFFPFWVAGGQGQQQPPAQPGSSVGIGSGWLVGRKLPHNPLKLGALRGGLEGHWKGRAGDSLGSCSTLSRRGAAFPSLHPYGYRLESGSVAGDKWHI